MKPLLALDKARIFYASPLSEPRLNHPESVVVAPDGSVWCGGEAGEIFRIEPDGSSMAVVASTGGFVLGLSFDREQNLFACDMKHQTVFRLDGATRALVPFARLPAKTKMVCPNSPIVDLRRDCLYVTDSHVARQPGPGVWRFDLATGEGSLWYSEPMNFANGLALDPAGERLYVVESWAYRVVAIPILPDGSAGPLEVVWDHVQGVPDGISVDVAGNIYVCMYTPAQVVRITPSGAVELLIEDPEHDIMRYPTACAFRGSQLFTANLGGWHITQIDAGIPETA